MGEDDGAESAARELMLGPSGSINSRADLGPLPSANSDPNVAEKVADGASLAQLSWRPVGCSVAFPAGDHAAVELRAALQVYSAVDFILSAVVVLVTRRCCCAQGDARCRVRSEAYFTPDLGIPLKIAAKFADDPELALRPSAGIALSRDVQTRGKGHVAPPPIMEAWACVAARGDPANTAAPLMLTGEASYSLSGRLIAPMLGGFTAENRRKSPSAAQFVLESRAALPNLGTLRLQARFDLATICPRSRRRFRRRFLEIDTWHAPRCRCGRAPRAQGPTGLCHV